MDSLLLFLKRPESDLCCAIDLNSKFETASKLKDSSKLKAFKQKLVEANYII